MKHNIKKKCAYSTTCRCTGKDCWKPLKFHIGNREATYFTKSTDYGKLLDNNHNDYLLQDHVKRAMAADFVQHFNIATPRKERSGKDDTFQDAVEDPQTTQQNDDAAREEIERLQMEREDQRQKSLEKVATEIGTMAGSSGGIVHKTIREKAEESHRKFLESLPHRQYLKR